MGRAARTKHERREVARWAQAAELASGPTEPPTIVAEELANCSAEQLAPGRGQQGVVAGPDPEVSAVLVELEHKVIE